MLAELRRISIGVRAELIKRVISNCFVRAVNI